MLRFPKATASVSERSTGQLFQTFISLSVLIWPVLSMDIHDHLFELVRAAISRLSVPGSLYERGVPFEELATCIYPAGFSHLPPALFREQLMSVLPPTFGPHALESVRAPNGQFLWRESNTAVETYTPPQATPAEPLYELGIPMPMTAEGLRKEIQRLQTKKEFLMKTHRRLLALHHLLISQADLSEETNHLETVLLSLHANHGLLDTKLKQLVELIDQDLGPT
jgi:hypothetical protein